jgi:hypothetical protein
MSRLISSLTRLLSLLPVIALAACASMATDRLASHLTSAMLNQTDPEIVRSGAPAYLLLLDSLIEENPRQQSLLYAGARLYNAYAGGLVSDAGRKRILTEKALDYAQRGLCPDTPQLCQMRDHAFTDFTSALERVDKGEIEGIYLYAVSWATWIQARSDDWHAVANLPRVEAMLSWVASRDPAYDNGRCQLYLGVISSQVPPALGGNPEIGRRHFEAAIAYSQGRDLMAKVEFARRYARLVFDRPLHDRLLNEVLQADPVAPGLTLSNIMAQRQAASLLQDDYF